MVRSREECTLYASVRDLMVRSTEERTHTLSVKDFY
jgi:hypothetical protein